MLALLESAILSATFWTAVAAVGSIATLFFIYKQIAAARAVSAYQFLRSEDERFDSSEMASERSDLARALILHPTRFERIDEHAEVVASYFEDLGLMLKERITPEFFIWTMYYDTIVGYWPLLKDYVCWLRTRDNDKTYYCEFENLYTTMVKVQQKRTKVSEVELPNRRALRDFLVDELQVGIRPFRLKDLDGVSEIERCAFDVDAYSQEDFQELYRKHSEGFFVAEMAGRLAGYVVGYPSEGAGEVDSIAVHPQDTSLGIGHQLLSHILGELKERGATRCSLEVRATNQSAIHLYETFGFRVEDTIPKYYKDNASAYRMTKTDL